MRLLVGASVSRAAVFVLIDFIRGLVDFVGFGCLDESGTELRGEQAIGRSLELVPL